MFTETLERLAALAHAGRHRKVVEAASAALASKKGSATAQIDLLDARIESLLALADVEAAERDATEMLARARANGSEALLSRAFARQSEVRLQRGLRTR